jgi:hypothetical protein
VALTGLKILYSFCIESISTILTFLTSFFYISSLICNLTLEWPVFHHIGVLVLSLYSTYERKKTCGFCLLSLVSNT